DLNSKCVGELFQSENIIEHYTAKPGFEENHMPLQTKMCLDDRKQQTPVMTGKRLAASRWHPKENGGKTKTSSNVASSPLK
ncbi:hypothetical protein NDU88_003208, partial [Pleurodeles waltl]